MPGDGYSVREVIDTAAKVTDRPISVTVVPDAPAIAVLVASSERNSKNLVWRPSQKDLDNHRVRVALDVVTDDDD